MHGAVLIPPVRRCFFHHTGGFPHGRARLCLSLFGHSCLMRSALAFPRHTALTSLRRLVAVCPRLLLIVIVLGERCGRSFLVAPLRGEGGVLIAVPSSSLRSHPPLCFRGGRGALTPPLLLLSLSFCPYLFTGFPCLFKHSQDLVRVLHDIGAAFIGGRGHVSVHDPYQAVGLLSRSVPFTQSSAVVFAAHLVFGSEGLPRLGVAVSPLVRGFYCPRNPLVQGLRVVEQVQPPLRNVVGHLVSALGLGLLLFSLQESWHWRVRLLRAGIAPGHPMEPAMGIISHVDLFEPTLALSLSLPSFHWGQVRKRTLSLSLALSLSPG